MKVGTSIAQKCMKKTEKRVDKMDIKKDQNYTVIYPSTHENMGLFDDLKALSNCNLIVRRQKVSKNSLYRICQKIFMKTSVAKILGFPNSSVWFEKINYLEEKNKCVIVVDGALNTLNLKALNELCNQKDTRVVLLLINSMNAHSVSMNYVRKAYKLINWSDVYSFDEEDVRKYGFKSIEYSYYSKKNISQDTSIRCTNYSDVYFVGWLKGNRTELLLELTERFKTEKCSIDFNISVSGLNRIRKLPYSDTIKYAKAKWIPYDSVVTGVLNSNVIVEILQEGQAGPSLRYYEAVCYNKKLLTTNKRIVNYPYYNPNYMKIIENVNDINFDWIKKREIINYGYKGDFSPLKMLSIVIR